MASESKFDDSFDIHKIIPALAPMTTHEPILLARYVYLMIDKVGLRDRAKLHNLLTHKLENFFSPPEKSDEYCWQIIGTIAKSMGISSSSTSTKTSSQAAPSPVKTEATPSRRPRAVPTQKSEVPASRSTSSKQSQIPKAIHRDRDPSLTARSRRPREDEKPQTGDLRQIIRRKGNSPKPNHEYSHRGGRHRDGLAPVSPKYQYVPDTDEGMRPFKSQTRRAPVRNRPPIRPRGPHTPAKEDDVTLMLSNVSPTLNDKAKYFNTFGKIGKIFKIQVIQSKSKALIMFRSQKDAIRVMNALFSDPDRLGFGNDINFTWAKTNLIHIDQMRSILEKFGVNIDDTSESSSEKEDEEKTEVIIISPEQKSHLDTINRAKRSVKQRMSYLRTEADKIATAVTMLSEQAKKQVQLLNSIKNAANLSAESKQTRISQIKNQIITVHQTIAEARQRLSINTVEAEEAAKEFEQLATQAGAVYAGEVEIQPPVSDENSEAKQLAVEDEEPEEGGDELPPPPPSENE